jgi:hypothetical protein
MYFHGLIPDEMFTRCALLFIIDTYFSMVFMSSQPSAVRLTPKSASRIARMMKVSGCKPTASGGMPDVLKLVSSLKPKTNAAFTDLTLPYILTADNGVKTPTAPDVRTTSGHLIDVDVFLIKNINLLKTKIYCQFYL